MALLSPKWTQPQHTRTCPATFPLQAQGPLVQSGASAHSLLLEGRDYGSSAGRVGSRASLGPSHRPSPYLAKHHAARRAFQVPSSSNGHGLCVSKMVVFPSLPSPSPELRALFEASKVSCYQEVAAPKDRWDRGQEDPATETVGPCRCVAQFKGLTL